MNIARRKFLNLLGVAGAAGLTGCDRFWTLPDQLVEKALRGPGLEDEVQTICGLCEGGCGVQVRLVDGIPVGLKGNPNHPLNRGGLCPVGQAGLEVLYSPDRLHGPLRRGPDGRRQPIGWDEALDEIANELAELGRAGESRRFAVLSGDWSGLGTDLAHQFTLAAGSPNFARSFRTEALPYRLGQGVSDVPGFDLSNSDLVLSFGFDLFEDGSAPVHNISALIGGRNDEPRSSLIYVGTRLSPSASKSEQYVRVSPNTHAAFALGVAHVLVREGRFDRDFVSERTFGFEDWSEDGRRHLGFRRLLIERYYPDRVAQLCGCDAAAVVRVARRFADAERPVALAGREAQAGSNGSWNVLAIHALNALTGVFDRPGGVVLRAPIPWTPLPRPEGAPDRSEQSIFSALPGRTLFGVDPWTALADHQEQDRDGIRVLFLLGANPLHESPEARRLNEAISHIPLVVAVTPFLDETAAHADIILPSPTYLEAWQCATTPEGTAFSVLGLAPPVVEPLFDTRHPGDILLDLSRRAGSFSVGALPWADYTEYLKNRLEGLAVSRQGAIVSGSFEESWKHFLEERGWRFSEHHGVEDFWEDLSRQSAWWNPVPSNGDWARLFPTPSNRYEFFSTALLQRLLELGRGSGGISEQSEALKRACQSLQLAAGPEEACLPHFEPAHYSGEGELTLIPFRPVTARGPFGVVSPMLMEMFGYPLLSGWETWSELGPETAHELGIEDGDLVALESDSGTIETVVHLRPGAAPGTVHVPMGLGHKAGPSEDLGANPVDLLAPVPDPLSGKLSLNSARVRLRLIRRRPRGGPAPSHHGGRV